MNGPRNNMLPQKYNKQYVPGVLFIVMGGAPMSRSPRRSITPPPVEAGTEVVCGVGYAGVEEVSALDPSRSSKESALKGNGIFKAEVTIERSVVSQLNA